MAKNVTGSIRDNMRRASDRGRGPIYKWLKKHHRAIKAGFTRTDASWDSVVATMISQGVRGRGDVEPNRKTVSKIWARVCRDLDEQAAQARRPKRARPGSWSPPSKSAPSADRHPPPGPTRRPTQPSAATAPVPPPTPEDLPDHAQATLAAIRRKLAHVDRHIVQSADED